MRTCTRFALTLFAAACSLLAQEYRGRIQGTILDASNAAAAGAKVVLTNVNTNVSRSTLSNTAGHYLFDLIEPGRYSLKVEASGFAAFSAPSILLQQRGDVTVDAVLTLGNVVQEVNVTASAAQIQFNTSKLETTVDSQVAANVPQFLRTPFFLSKLDPSVAQSETRLESQPYHSTGAGTQQVGGVNGMDLQVDGVPVTLGTFTGYQAAPDMVAEVNVQVNSVDAEFGQSTGAAISVTMKSGTNQFHGSAFYQGVYPWANAILNRVNRTPNIQRNHMYGATLGHPIVRNKWFNFVAFEGWQLVDPQTIIGQLPTDRERRGDYSQSLNQRGALRAIYDGFSTQTSPDGATVTRAPFPGNVIPASRISRVAAAYAAALPAPNQPGVGAYNARNYVVPLRLFTPYRNFADRTDYVMSAKLRFTGRVSLFRTPISASNPLESDLAWLSDRGSNRHATQYSGGFTWMRSANMVVDGVFSYYGFVDESNPVTTFKGYDHLWPGSTWYKTMFDSGVIPAVSPGMKITHGDGGSIMSSYSSGIGTNGPYWKKRPWQDFGTLKMAYSRGAHYLKAGFESRGARSWQVPQLTYPYFSFNATATSNTYVNPDTRVSGDGFASFLLGAVNDAQMPVRVNANLTYRMYGLYLNDDWKINRNLTLNLGLRWEHERPFGEENDRAARGLDLTVPIRELQGASAPQIPAQVRQFYGGTWTFNGAYRWTENGGGQWDAKWGTVSPRIGVAYRLNDKTSVRAGYGRYISPWTRSTNITQGNFYGFALQTAAATPVLGIPQMTLDNPYSPSSYPIQPVLGKTLGDYTGLGDSLSWTALDRPRQHLNRLNVSLQRQVALGLVVDATYYLNDFNNPSSRNINMVDPRIAYQYKSAINASIANPFYQLLPADKFPGPLRNQRTVGLTSLMVPYPQYGSLTVSDYEDNARTQFQQFGLRVRKSYSHGLTFLGGYTYTYSKSLIYYDDQATFLQERTWQFDAQPRNRFTLGGTWELPFGRGRQFAKGVPRALDAVIGGWNISPVITWRSGNYLSFPGLVVNGDPHVDNPGPKGWFNTAVFSILPAYTRRANPVVYDGITGPGYFNMDASLRKSFAINERFHAELRVDSFNLPNSMTWNDPSTSISSTFFGKSSDNLNANGIGIGRQTQLGLRLRF